MAASLEVELKLRAEDDDPLRRLATIQSLGRFRLSPASTAFELDRYLDTADGRLSAARWACRLRTRDGSVRISLKGPAQHVEGDPLHRRPEIEGPATSELDATDWPPSPARDAVLELAGPEPLIERLALEQERTERAVADSKPVGVLSLDRVTVVMAGQVRGRFLAVELELRGEAPDVRGAHELLQTLQAFGGLQLEPRSKLERALDMVATGP